MCPRITKTPPKLLQNCQKSRIFFGNACHFRKKFLIRAGLRFFCEFSKILGKGKLRRGDKIVHLGCFDTAEEAALCVARCEFEAANEAKRQAVASVRASATPEEVHEMAGHEKLQLKKRKSYSSFSGVHPVPVTSNSGTGFKGWFVSDEPRVLGRPKYFEAVEAALVVARTREHRKQNPGCTQYPPEMLVVNPTGVRQLRPIITESQYTASPATPDGVPVAHGYLPPMA